ncbi:toxin-antitoxin system YwqK family antitoxin [Pedobacter psychroterrae]|uniref:MORN repeat protein n=1 Tax=Pedobacter psychroterrae TaxID=2530453 RepID=A0A4R0NGU8_9SPHI|nr:hypothetical protein [Pedobacter psychroterrae]TCC99771.1 hypothetical protein EZ437_16145 [Pedobacter psychroterrae]
MKGKIILLLGLSWLVACKPMELKQIDLIKNRVMVQVADTVIKAELMEGKISIDLRHTYFWFENGRINSSQGAYSGKLLHGNFKSYHSGSKRLLVAGQLDHGLKTGSWLSWYGDGNLMQRKMYKNGLLDGLFMQFDSSGRPVDTMKYRKGILKQQKTDTVGFYRKFKRFLKFKKK